MTKNNEKKPEIQEKKEKNEFSYIESTALKELGLASISQADKYIRKYESPNPNKIFLARSGSKEIQILDILESDLQYDVYQNLIKAHHQRDDKIELVDIRKIRIKNNASYSDRRVASSQFIIDLSISDLKELFTQCIQNGLDIFPEMLGHIFEDNASGLDYSLESINIDDAVNKAIDVKLNQMFSDDTLNMIKEYEQKNGKLADLEWDKVENLTLSRQIKVSRITLRNYRDITGHEKEMLTRKFKRIRAGLRKLLPDSKKELLTEEKNKIKSNLLASLSSNE